MMIEEKKVPSWLKNNVRNYVENDYRELIICSLSGNELLEIWYYGDWLEIKGEKRYYLVATKTAPVLVVAKDTETGEEILIFDAAKHGYDNMFCDTYDEEVLHNRQLKKLDIPLSKLFVRLGYSIDYEDEKEDYDFDANGNVILIDGRKISWDEVLTDGMDYIALFYITEKGDKIQFVDYELA